MMQYLRMRRNAETLVEKDAAKPVRAEEETGEEQGTESEDGLLAEAMGAD